MEETVPPDVEKKYKTRLTNFKGKTKPFLSERSNQACALVALQNFVTLLMPGNTSRDDILEGLDPESLKSDYREILNDTGDEDVHETKGNLEEVVNSLDSCVVLDPINTHCLSFDESDELLLFKKLGFPVVHGWVLDETKENLCLAKGFSHSRFLSTTAKNDDALVKELDDFMKASVTEQGLSQMRNVLASKKLVDEINKLGDLAIFYSENKYFILYQHKEDLFTLETDKDILSYLPGATWKKLWSYNEDFFFQKMFILHDVTIVELMLARRLERYIADAIRTIILEFGVDDTFLTVWDHLDFFDCSKIPIQQVTDNIDSTDATIESITKSDVTLMVPVASSQVKSDNKIRMPYTEVDGCSSGLNLASRSTWKKKASLLYLQMMS